jgi:hypothetical protein
MAEVERPNPLAKVATTVGGVVAALGGVVGALVQLGVLSDDQVAAVTAAGAVVEPTINGLGVLLGGVMPIVAALVAAFATVKVGKAKVTPNESPAAEVINPETGKRELVALVPATSVPGAHAAVDPAVTPDTYGG